LIQKIHPNYFVAQNLGFEESILLNTKFTSLNGYFQSYEYFEIFRGHLPNWEPRLKKYSKNFLTTKQELVHGRERISIHLRRGDYRKLKGSFGLLAHDYYIESVSSAINEFGNLDILIFGDEHDENLLLKLALKERGYESQVFQPKEDMLNIESMLLMSYCAVNIISNSTFGWWGARFNQNPSAIYAPSKWFKSLEDPHRLIPPNWICIDPVWIS